MESIRKSASFRSRIPVRRNQLTPQLMEHTVNVLTNSASVSAIRFPVKTRRTKKVRVEKVQMNSKDRRRYNSSSSSSYSSSDESKHSQEPHLKKVNLYFKYL